MQDVPAICQRLLSKKRLTVEANRAKTEADLKMREAQANLETARKIAEAAKVEEERLQMELEAGLQVSLDNLNNGQAGGGTPSVPQGAADVGLGPAADPHQLPARPLHVQPLAPVIATPRVTNTPNPPPGQLSQVEKARIAVEDERRKALEEFEANAEAAAREEVPYNAAYDFSFLRKYNSEPNEIETNKTPPSQRSADRDRASAAKKKGGVAMHTSLGQRPTAPSRRSRPRTESGLQQTTHVVSKIKSNPTKLTISPKEEVGEETKTADQNVGEAENAGGTDLHQAETTTIWEGIANLEVGIITVKAQSSSNFNFNFIETDTSNFNSTNNISLSRGSKVNKHNKVTTGTIEIIPPTTSNINDKDKYISGNDNISTAVKGSNNNIETKATKPLESKLEYKSRENSTNSTRGENNETKNNNDTKCNDNETNKKESEISKKKSYKKFGKTKYRSNNKITRVHIWNKNKKKVH